MLINNKNKNSEPNLLKRNARKILGLLSTYFSKREETIKFTGNVATIIAEDTVYLASRIIGKKVMKTGDHHYYFNSGLY